MSNELQNNSALSWDFLDDDAPASAPFLKFKQGQYFCAPLTGDKEVDLTGSLFVAAMPTFRQTLTAWTDAQKAPVEQYSAYLALGQKLPSQRTDYPIRANGQDAWQDGFAIDGMLLVAGAWKQASYTAGTVTSNIALRQAMQGVKQLMGRTYRPDDWSPVWELGKYGELKAKSGTMVKTPNLVLLGLVNKDVETAGTQPGLTDLSETLAALKGQVPCDPQTSAPFMLPSVEPLVDMGSNTPQMLASGVAVPQSPKGGISNDLNDDIPF